MTLLLTCLLLLVPLHAVAGPVEYTGTAWMDLETFSISGGSYSLTPFFQYQSVQLINGDESRFTPYDSRFDGTAYTRYDPATAWTDQALAVTLPGNLATSSATAGALVTSLRLDGDAGLSGAGQAWRRGLLQAQNAGYLTVSVGYGLSSNALDRTLTQAFGSSATAAMTLQELYTVQALQTPNGSMAGLLSLTRWFNAGEWTVLDFSVGLTGAVASVPEPPLFWPMFLLAGVALMYRELNRTVLRVCILVCVLVGLTFVFPGYSTRVWAQSYCSQLGSTVICDGGATTITPLGRNGGVIQDDRGVMPYTILPAPDHTRAGIEPLDRLDRLDDLSRPSRPDREEFRSPFDLQERDGLLLLPE